MYFFSVPGIVPAPGLPAADDPLGGVRGDVRDSYVRGGGVPGARRHALPLHGAQVLLRLPPPRPPPPRHHRAQARHQGTMFWREIQLFLWLSDEVYYLNFVT